MCIHGHYDFHKAHQLTIRGSIKMGKGRKNIPPTKHHMVIEHRSKHTPPSSTIKGTFLNALITKHLVLERKMFSEFG